MHTAGHVAAAWDTAAWNYVGPTGAVTTDPLAGVARPAVSLGKLARQLANPVIEMNLGAPCVWSRVRRLRPVPDLRVREVSALAELRERFSLAVRHAMGDAETVVVFFSGGLDSLAVLVEGSRQCARDGRRVVPLTWDLTDQTGVRAADVARFQLAAVDTGLRPVVVEERWHDLREPEWSPHGPRSDCHGRLRRLTDEYVASLPQAVMLTGQGGDEVCSAWNFGSRALGATRRWRDLRRYLGAFARHQTLVEVAGEALSVVAGMLPASWSFRGYLATAWRDVLSSDPGGVVGERFRPAVGRAHRAWLSARWRTFREQRQSWVDAMFFDQLYPFVYDAHPPDAPVPNRSPFLDRQFVRYVAGLPWPDRFDASPRDGYHWYKALQLRLLPPPIRRVAPLYKAHYGAAVNRYVHQLAPKPRLLLTELGVLAPIEFGDLAARHAYLPVTVRNLELWLRGAVERGYALSDQ